MARSGRNRHSSPDSPSPLGEISRDVGTGRLQAQRQSASDVWPPMSTIGQPARLDGHSLRDVVNDTSARAYCGPTAVASITGTPISLVRDCYRLVRYGARWVNLPRAPRIAGTYWYETEKVLRMLGFIGTWHSVRGSPTLAAFLEQRSGTVRSHPCAIFVTRHVVAVSGWQFCDTFSNGVVVEADDAPRRRKRVKKVFVITGHVPPSTIPRKNCPAARAKAVIGQKVRGT